MSVNDDHFDFIIVGGGSAGSVLAGRLSQDPAHRVLVLEAGRSDYPWDLFIQMPGAYAFPIGNRLYDWKYQTEPEPHMGGRRIYHVRGKVLGGCSSINGMVFQRGNPLDYDNWAREPGLQDWDYAHCLPYFKRMETRLAGGDVYRGDRGPLAVSRGEATRPLFRAFLTAAMQAGYPSTTDVNGYQQEGFGKFDQNILNGQRHSASRAYLRPAKRRANLTVRCRRLVHRVLFEGSKAVGVEYSTGRGPLRRAYATEVILCGGAFNTPQVLQLSGVGNPEHLLSLGIPLVHALPGVGEHLQDHLETYIQYACKEPVSLSPAIKLRNRPLIGLQWLLTRPHTGLAASNHAEAGGFARSNNEVERPNLQFHFIPIAIRYDSTRPTEGHGYQIHIGPMFSEDRGTVRITSRDPRRHPAIQFNYLATDSTRKEWVEAVRIARTILNQPAFAQYNAGELSPGPSVQTDQEILDWVARDAETALHPCGTARMGITDHSVVDPATMKVHGLEGLRVVDASVFPTVPNANIYAPVIMVAEKSADLILGHTPLAPEAVEFYRVDAASKIVKP